MAHEMIHGGGSDYNTGNRWFDKTMQVTKNSKQAEMLMDFNLNNIPFSHSDYHLQRRNLGLML